MASELSAECSLPCHVARATQYTRASRKRELRLSSHSSGGDGGGVCDTLGRTGNDTISARFTATVTSLLHAVRNAIFSLL